MVRCLSLLLTCSLLLASGSAQAQTAAADSLRGLLAAGAPSDTARLRWTIELGKALASVDAAEALRLNQQTLTLARQLGEPLREAQIHLSISNLSRRQADYPAARQHARLAQHIFQRHHNVQGQGKAYLQLSLADQMQGNLASALALALRGLPLAVQAHDQVTQTRLRSTLGAIYIDLEDYQSAVPMLLAALRSGRQLHDQQVVATALNGLGNAYSNLNQLPRALQYFQQALRLSQQLGDQQGEVSNETSLSYLYGQQQNHELALAHGLRALKLVQQNHDDYNLPSVKLLLAQTYLASQRPDSAIALGRHSLQLSQQTHSLSSVSAANDVLARAYAQRGDFRQAYYYQNQHLAYQDSLAGEDVQRETAALRYGYELDRKKARIALLEKTRQLEIQKSARQRQQLYALLSGLAGLVLIAALLWRNVYLKQRANRHLNEKNAHIAQQRDELNQTLTQLKTTQYQLAQREKMALLGELTAGVAHEIQNPLNFVNNFSEVSSELLDELRQELSREHLSADGTGSIEGLLHDLSESQQKIQHHGQRADAIVRNMLEHSRHHAGTLQPTDLNALIEQTLRLAYSNQLADSAAGPITLTTSFDPQVGMINTMPQDLSRALLHLFNNAFYAVRQRQQSPDLSYQPAVTVSTHRLADEVEIRVRDNGSGIPIELTEKIFQPFFTTKPPGKGTGLGLSLSYDIISKGHGGNIRAESREGEYAQFIVVLPARHVAATLDPVAGPSLIMHQPV